MKKTLIVGIQEVEKTLLPKWYKSQISKMIGVKNFGVRQGVSEISDVVSDASIQFIKDIRRGTIKIDNHIEGYRLFQKYVHFELKKHRSGRVIRQKDGTVSYPESHFVSGVSNFEELAENSVSYELSDPRVKKALKFLESDPRFEILKLSVEGWGIYQLANRLKSTWFIAEKELESQRKLFISEFNLNWLL